MTDDIILTDEMAAELAAKGIDPAIIDYLRTSPGKGYSIDPTKARILPNAGALAEAFDIIANHSGVVAAGKITGISALDAAAFSFSKFPLQDNEESRAARETFLNGYRAWRESRGSRG